MATEIEVKILDIDADAIVFELEQIGAVLIGNELQVNEVFHGAPSQATVRLRTVMGRTTLTTKMPVYHKRFKIRKELESSIDDRETFIQQLMMMGLKRTWYIEKRRAIYRHCDAIVTIDEYPGIPAFLEIEGDKEHIERVLSHLGLTINDSTNITFRQLIKHYRPGVQDLRFQ